jgi:hypothetical protein
VPLLARSRSESYAGRGVTAQINAAAARVMKLRW